MLNYRIISVLEDMSEDNFDWVFEDLCPEGGNVAAVVAGDSLVQRTSYYPYGLPHANAHGATANPYKYGGKEFDTFGGTDLYDFHARFHAPSTGRFMTVDPLCEEKPHLSGYAYCAGNPINLIDPTGMDEIKMNQLGEIVKQIETKDFDTISIVDDNGDMITGANFDLGTIERVSTTPINSTKSFDTYQIRGDQNSEIFFEKVSNATNVEWGEVKTGESGDKGKNYITTSHQDAQNDALTYLFNGQLLSGYTIREVNHNHPHNTPRPSGLNIGENDNDGDIQFAQKLCKKLGYKPSFSIYLKETDSYIKYTPRSTSKDFQ